MTESTGIAADSGSLEDRAWSESEFSPVAEEVPARAQASRAYRSDEEILEMDSPDASRRTEAVAEGDSRSGEAARSDRRSRADGERDSKRGEGDLARAAKVGEAGDGAMPAWMQTLASDPQHGAEAQQFWQDHQEFRAAFSSPQEAREIKELFPGGAQDARALRQASQAVDQLDAAIYSGDVRAQSEVVTELARTNPAAFRSLFAEAAKVLAGMGGAGIARDSGVREGREERGSREDSGVASGNRAAQATAGTEARVTEGEPSGGARQAPAFNPAAYASFERATNDTVARDVRSAVSETLARVLPEGIAQGAARRIGDDIFNEVHRTLAADRTLSEQVGAVLRERRFGMAEQQQVAALLAGRAKQLVPAVARRVVGEWTSSVLSTARNKAARQSAAAARVDIGAPGGSRDSVPLRAMTAREVNYASMSDDDILGM